MTAKKDNWQVPSAIALIVVSIIGWFLTNMYADQKGTNTKLWEKIGDNSRKLTELDKELDKSKAELERKVATYEYTCCRAKNGRYQ